MMRCIIIVLGGKQKVNLAGWEVKLDLLIEAKVLVLEREVLAFGNLSYVVVWPVNEIWQNVGPVELSTVVENVDIIVLVIVNSNYWSVVFVKKGDDEMLVVKSGLILDSNVHINGLVGVYLR